MASFWQEQRKQQRRVRVQDAGLGAGCSPWALLGTKSACMLQIQHDPGPKAAEKALHTQGNWACHGNFPVLLQQLTCARSPPGPANKEFIPFMTLSSPIQGLLLPEGHLHLAL